MEFPKKSVLDFHYKLQLTRNSNTGIKKHENIEF